jgi:hypothetical protein
MHADSQGHLGDGGMMGIGLGGLHTRHVYLHQAMLFYKDDLEYNNDYLKLCFLFKIILK